MTTLSSIDRDKNFLKDIEGLVFAESDSYMRVRKVMVMMLGELQYLGYKNSSDLLAKILDETWSKK
jgi:hypothetical protein